MTWTSAVVGVLVLSFAMYVFFLFNIALEKTRKRRPLTEMTSEYKLESVLASPGLDCEFALLWQTEAPVLEKLKQSGTMGLSEGELRAIYPNIASRYPELCDGLPFDEWVQTLERLEVVSRNSNSLTITEKGLFILDFAKEQSKCPCEDAELLGLSAKT